MVGRKLVKIVTVDRLNPDKVDTVERGFDIPIAVGESVSKLDISFPHAWEPEGARAIVDHAEYDRDDRIQAFVSLPTDPFLGTAEAAAAINDTEVLLDEALLKLLKPGHRLSFGTATEGYLIESIDTVAMSVTLHTGLVVAVADGEGVKVRTPFVQDVRPMKDVLDSFGDITPGAKHIVAGATLHIEYHHKNAPTVVENLHVRVIYKF